MSDDPFRDGEDAAANPAEALDISDQVESDTLDDSPPEVSEDTHGMTDEELAGEDVADENENVPEDVPGESSVDTPEETFSALPEDVPDASLHASEGGRPSENQDSIPEDSPEDLPPAFAETTPRGTDEYVSEDALAERSDRDFQEQSEERTTGDSVDQSATEDSEHHAATRTDGYSGDPGETTSEVQEDALQHPSGQSEEQPLDTAQPPEAPLQAQATDGREPPSDGQSIEAPSDQPATNLKGQSPPEGIETDDGSGLHEQVDSGYDVQREIDHLSENPGGVENLPDFEPERWDRMSMDDRKESIERLADFNADILGLEHKPSLDYYQAESPGEYGGFSPETNSLRINERKLDDGLETADTVSHELRHAYQYQHAQSPESEQDLLFRENIENYVAPEQDFTAYRDQILESDARDYAQQRVKPRDS